jgi:hypothetical protein
MPDDRCVQPRQIYASTLTRRERRWARRRTRSVRASVLLMACAVTAFSVVAAVAPTLI